MGARYIVVEGVTGVGKTHLATLLAARLGARLEIEEPDDNPFLPLFYEDPGRYGFQAQVFYLLEGQGVVVADEGFGRARAGPLDRPQPSLERTQGHRRSRGL